MFNLKSGMPEQLAMMLLLSANAKDVYSNFAPPKIQC